MGFLNRGNSAIYEGAYNGALHESIADIEEIMPKYENFDEASLCNILEADRNYQNIMEAIALNEYDYFQATGEEIVYEAGGLSSFFSKVKAFFVNLYQKIKGLFKKFIALIDSYVKDDKDFVNKYRRQLLSVNTKDFEYKGYEFDDSKISGINIESCMNKAYKETELPELNASSTEIENVDDKLKKVEDQSDMTDKMRGAALGQAGGSSSPIDTGEFSKELFMLFRKGEDSKDTLDKISVSDQIGYIINYGDTKKKAEKSFKDLEKSINNTLRTLDKLEKDAVSKVPGKTEDEKKKDFQDAQSKFVRGIHACITYTKIKLSIGQTINGALLTALKDRSRQAKSICVALLNYKPKNESAGYYEESGIYGNALDSVVIK